MKRKQFTEEQIIGILKEAEAGAGKTKEVLPSASALRAAQAAQEAAAAAEALAAA